MFSLAGTQQRRLLVLVLSLVSMVVFMVGCGASSGTSTLAAVPPTTIATVPYLPPTVVARHHTPTPRPTPRATAIPAATALPAATATPYVVPTATPPPAGPTPYGGVPALSGQLILVSLAQQWMWVYQNRHLLYDTPITSGMPELPTPTGIYQVQEILDDVYFNSAWPPGSPYYYPPEYVNHAFYFLAVGYYLHDAPWRRYFGPGTNYPHTNPNGTKETGSHGCVEMPVAASDWLRSFANVGATIDIYGATPQPPATPTAPPTLPTPTAVPPTATAVPPTATATP